MIMRLISTALRYELCFFFKFLLLACFVFSKYAVFI